MDSEFMEFIESVETSIREFYEDELYIAGVPTHDLNPPSVAGAIAGLSLPRPPTDCGMCKTCAFRPGTAANRTVNTVEAALECLDDKTAFYCHGYIGGDRPTGAHVKKLCRGFMAVRRLAERGTDGSA